MEPIKGNVERRTRSSLVSGKREAVDTSRRLNGTQANLQIKAAEQSNSRSQEFCKDFGSKLGVEGHRALVECHWHLGLPTSRVGLTARWCSALSLESESHFAKAPRGI